MSGCLLVPSRQLLTRHRRHLPGHWRHLPGWGRIAAAAGWWGRIAAAAGWWGRIAAAGWWGRRRGTGDGERAVHHPSVLAAEEAEAGVRGEARLDRGAGQDRPSARGVLRRRAPDRLAVDILRAQRR